MITMCAPPLQARYPAAYWPEIVSVLLKKKDFLSETGLPDQEYGLQLPQARLSTSAATSAAPPSTAGSTSGANTSHNSSGLASPTAAPPTASTLKGHMSAAPISPPRSGLSLRPGGGVATGAALRIPTAEETITYMFAQVEPRVFIVAVYARRVKDKELAQTKDALVSHVLRVLRISDVLGHILKPHAPMTNRLSDF